MAASEDQLSIYFDGACIGVIMVEKKMPRKVFGRFVPNQTFESIGSHFLEAFKWSEQFEKSHSDSSLDYRAFDRYVAAIQELLPRIALPEVSYHIEEFGIHHDLTVEITFDDQPPE